MIPCHTDQFSEHSVYTCVCCAGAAGLIRHMLTVSPARRATLTDVLNHWWVNLGHELTPDGRRYEAAPLPVGRASHRQQSSFSSDSDMELDARCPPPGLHHVPGARTGKKSAETSFDEDEMLYDIGMSTSSSSTPAASVSPATVSVCVGEQQSRAANDKNNLHWRQAIANGIEEIRSRVMQSLADDDVSHRREEDDDEEEAKMGDSTSGRADSNANSDLCDTDDSSAFSGEKMPVLDNDKPVNVFDSDRKPKRGILKRKGKFSGGDSGCCIMADDASPKLEEEECAVSKSIPSDPSSSSSYAFPSSAQSSFSKDLASEPASANSQSLMTSQVEGGMSPPVPPSSITQGQPCPIHHCQTPITPAYTTASGQAAQSHDFAHVPSEECATKRSPDSSHPDPAHVCATGGNPASAGSSSSSAPGVDGPAPNVVCTCTVDMDLTKVVRRRKGILKNTGSSGNRSSLIDDARKRLSIGSLSSNSSADILDLSYDSGDGEQFTARCLSTSAATGHRDDVSMEPGDRNSFSLEGEFTAFNLDGISGGLYPGSQPPFDEKLFQYADAKQVLQQAVSLLNTSDRH